MCTEPNESTENPSEKIKMVRNGGRRDESYAESAGCQERETSLSRIQNGLCDK